MKPFNTFLLISVFCILTSQNAYSAAAKPASKPVDSAQKGSAEENPIALILSVTLLKSCLNVECAGTQGQLANMNERPVITFLKNDPVEVLRGFNANTPQNKGKVRGNLVATSQGRVSTPQAVIEVFKQNPSEFAFYAGQVVPLDTISDLSTKDDKTVVEALIKFYEENPKLIDPNHMYYVEGPNSICHYTSLKPAVYGPVAPTKPAVKLMAAAKK